MGATMITNFFSTTGKRKPDHVDGNNNEAEKQAIIASHKTLPKWEKELHSPIGLTMDGESRTVLEFWCEICRTFCDIILYKVHFKFLDKL
jgi:hypothetical protein